jgi:aminoglycoside 6'-N-acetyltransferase
VVTDGNALSSVHAAIEPLDGDGIHLRPSTPNDRDLVHAILADPTVAAWWQTEDPRADAADLLEDPELALWIVEAAPHGTPIGLIMASEEADPQYRHAGIDIALAAHGQGRGLGREAVRTVARWLVDARGHHRLTIDPSAENARAIRTYTSLGFRPVGLLRAYERWRDGSWHDGLLMDLLADDLR